MGTKLHSRQIDTGICLLLIRNNCNQFLEQCRDTRITSGKLLQKNIYFKRTSLFLSMRALRQSFKEWVTYATCCYVIDFFLLANVDCWDGTFSRYLEKNSTSLPVCSLLRSDKSRDMDRDLISTTVHKSGRVSCPVHYGNSTTSNYRPIISSNQKRWSRWNSDSEKSHDHRSRSVFPVEMWFFADRNDFYDRASCLVEGGKRVGKMRHRNITRYSTRIDITEQLITWVIARPTTVGCSRIAHFLPTALLSRDRDRADKSQTIVRELADTRPARRTWQCRPEGAEGQSSMKSSNSWSSTERARWEMIRTELISPIDEEWTFPRAYSSPSFNPEKIIFDLC